MQPDTYPDAELSPDRIASDRSTREESGVSALSGAVARLVARVSGPARAGANGMVWNSIGSVGYLFLHALGIALIARTAGAEAVGIYLLAQAVGMPLSLLCGLRYHDINATEAQVSRLGGHVRNVLLVSVPATALALAFWLSLTDGATRAIGANIILANVLQGFAQVPQGRMIRLRKFRAAALFEVSRGVTSVLSFSVGLLLFDSLHLATVALLSCWIVLLGVEYRTASRLSRPHRRRDSGATGLVEQMRYALGDALALFQTSSVRLVVGAIMGEIAVGILGATALLIKFLHPIAVALAKTVLPDLVDELAREDYERIGRKLRRINVATAASVGLFAALGYWLAPPLIELLLGPALRPPPLVAAILMTGAAPLIGSRFLNHMLIALRERRSVESSAWLALLCSVALAVPLTLAFGLPGAAAALAVSYSFRYSLEALYVSRSVRNLGK